MTVKVTLRQLRVNYDGALTNRWVMIGTWEQDGEEVDVRSVYLTASEKVARSKARAWAKALGGKAYVWNDGLPASGRV